MAARPLTITNAHLLEVARDVFLREGYGASTAAIAHAVGCSEGTLFKRFSTKEELFSAALGMPKPEWRSLLEPGVPRGTPRETLQTVAASLVAFLREAMPRMMMLRSHPSYDPHQCFRGTDKPPPVRNAEAVSRFLAEAQAAGELGSCDCEAVARTFVGALHSFVFFEVMGFDRKGGRDADAFASELVEILWRGIAPREDQL